MATDTTYSFAQYLECKSDLYSKVLAIEAMIDQMLLKVAEHATGAAVKFSEYQLDDGQVKINAVYRSVGDVKDGVLALEQLKQVYLNRLKGRTVVLRDQRSMRR